MTKFYCQNNRFWLFILLFLSQTLYAQQAAKPAVSTEGGRFTNPISVSLSSATANAQIFYTTDGSEPTNTAASRYAGPLSISTNTALRVRAYATGNTPSEVTTHTYLFNANHTFPIAAVSFKPADFFGDSGIYTLYEIKKEVPIHLEFFEASGNRAAFSLPLKTEIQGSTSAQLPQKSLEIKASGTGVPYSIFPTLPYTSYRRFVLRNSGQDWGITQFRDAMVQSLALRINDLGGILATPNLFLQDYRPSVVYYNGQYWGIHNIRERMNRFYVEQHFGWASTSFDMIENWGAEVNNGDATVFNAFYGGLNNRNFANNAEFDILKTEIDIANFLDYNAFNVLVDNYDWPFNNVRMFRNRTGGKWQWLSYDHDFSFGLFSPGNWNTGIASQNSIHRLLDPTGFGWPNDSRSTLLIRKCIENARFRRDFINRTADMLNTMFKSSRVVGRINDFENLYAPEITRHAQRWGSPYMGIFMENTNKMKSFANLRPDFVREHFNAEFSEVTGSADITLAVSPSGAGSLTFSTLNLSGQNLPFTGTYFTGVDIPVQAVAAAGYKFERWSDASLGTSPTVLVNLSAAKNLTAIFAPITTNPCSPDNVPPTFANCPPNISLKTLSSCANASWTAPTAIDNCTTTPSVSSNFASGFCFAKGTSIVTYTATDAANNRTTCSFTVVVADSTPVQTGTCKRFTAANVNNLCGCVVPTYQPYTLFLEQTGVSCLGTLFQNENLILEQTSPTTATLKGRLRGSDWTPIDIDIQLTGGNSTTTPVRIQCLAGLPLSATNGWFYYSQMTGTMKIGAAAPLSISLFNTPFQIGRGANQQNADLNGASAKFRLSNGETGWLQFLFNTETAIACSGGGGGTDPCTTDNIAPVWTNCPQNINLTTNTNCAAAVWTAPTATDNCTATPSVSSNFLSGFCFPIGTNTVTYTATDSRNNTKMCSFAVTVQQASTLSDLALSLSANSPNYTIYTISTFTLTAKNQGTTPFSNVKIGFPFPTKTAKGGDVLPTLGSWTEYCFGGVPCFEWTMPSLAAGATATLTVPLFIQNATTTITATATLKSSTPTDNSVANNTASSSINPVVPIVQSLVAVQPTYINPVVIQALYPNPTVQELTLDLVCLTTKEVTFNIYNTLGEVVLSETRVLKKGNNNLVLDVSYFTDGVFYIVPNTNLGRGRPTKFVKF